MKNPYENMISSSSVSKLKSTIIFILIYLEHNLRLCVALPNQSLSRPPYFGGEHHPNLGHHHTIRHSRHSMSKDNHEQRLLNAINLFKLSNTNYNNSKSTNSFKHLHHSHHHRTTSTAATTTTTTVSPSLYQDDWTDLHNFGSRRNDYNQKSWTRQQHLKRLYDEDDDEDEALRTVAPAKTHHTKHQPSAWSKYFDNRRHETRPPYRPFKRYDYNYNFESPTTTSRYGLISQHQNKYKQQNHYGGNKKIAMQTKSLHADDSSLDDMNYDYLDEEQDDSDDDDRRTSRRNKDDELVLAKDYVPGSLTDQKFNMLGTRIAVERAHNEYVNQRRNQHALAEAHASKIQNEGACKVPKPRLVTVNRDPSKIYQPHCTLLHQCSDDTGCCYTWAKTCVAKSSETVKLLFRVITPGSNKKAEIEELEFTNHTECHCVNRDLGLRPTTLRTTVQSFDNPIQKNCTCPSQFDKKWSRSGECECDCSVGNTGCDWIKKGMEHFSLDDRRCIDSEICQMPTCEFGVYLKKYGRCPRKSDKMSLS